VAAGALDLGRIFLSGARSCRHLFFAGEHVCMPFFAYMEGALESGAMVAKKILST